MMKRQGLRVVAIAAVLAGVSACSSEPEPIAGNELTAAPENGDAMPADVPTETPLPPPPVEPPVVNAVEALPPEEAPSPDEQVLDDASTTGMTSRVTRDDEPADTAPAAEPVRNLVD